MSLVPLIISSYLVVTTIARPDVSLGYIYDHVPVGYHYEVPNKHYIPTNSLRSDNSAGYFQQGSYDTNKMSMFELENSNIQTASNAAFQTVQSSGISSNSSSSVTTQQQTGGISTSSSGSNQQDFRAIITKNIYVFTAAEEPEELPMSRQIQLGRPMRNYRLIFIKAPTYAPKQAPIEPIYPQNDEKTIIYVLSKKPDDAVPIEISTPGPIAPSKPEVRFVKYKTIEEATEYQNKIQAEYDAYEGGRVQTSDEGVQPVQSIIRNNDASSSVSGSATIVGSTSSSSGSATGQFTGLTGQTSTSGSSSSTGTVTGQISEGMTGQFVSQSQFGSASANTKTPARNYLPPKPY